METVRKRAFAYRRVSTEGQVDGASLDTQTKTVEQYADSNNIEIVKWFEDPGISAKNARNRPGVQDLIRSAKEYRGDIDYLIVYSVSRISRSTPSYYREIWYELESYGITLRVATEPVNESPYGRFYLNISLANAQLDNEIKGKQTQDNMATHLSSGGWWMSRAPLGFKIQQVPTGAKDNHGKPKTHSRLVPDNTNGLADKLTALLTRFSTGDLNSTQLLKLAHQMEIRSRTGKLLPKTTLDSILIKPVYAGWHHSPTMTKGELVKMNFDGLIPLEVYEKNQRIINSDSRPHEESDNSLYPLHKTICCAICGAEMTDEEREARFAKGKLPYLRSSAPTSGSGKRTPRYSCKCKGHGSALASEVHQVFEAYLKQITPEEGVIKLFKEVTKRTALKKLGNINKEIEKYEQERAKLSEKKQKAIAAMLDGDISKEEKEEYIAGLNNERNEVEDELEKLKRAQMLREADIEYVCNFMRNPAKLWRDGDLETRQALQKMIFPHGVYFDLKNKKCGTSEISPLFSINTIKKAPQSAILNDMGWDIGLEPTTFWTTIRCSNQLS